MRVLVLDDHVMFLQGLRGLLSVMAPQLQVHICDHLRAALEAVRQQRFDLVLLDWNLGEDGSGAQAMAALRDAGCAARFVVLSGQDDQTLVNRAVSLGAAGFVPKRYSSEQMIRALQVVLAGSIYLPARTYAPPLPTPASGSTARDKLAALTPRQLEVYRAAARGLPNKLIAAELGIAESTIKSHLKAVFAALGVRNRTEAAYQASREGIAVDA